MGTPGGGAVFVPARGSGRQRREHLRRRQACLLKAPGSSRQPTRLDAYCSARIRQGVRKALSSRQVGNCGGRHRVDARNAVNRRQAITACGCSASLNGHIVAGEANPLRRAQHAEPATVARASVCARGLARVCGGLLSGNCFLIDFWHVCVRTEPLMSLCSPPGVSAAAASAFGDVQPCFSSPSFSGSSSEMRNVTSL